MVQSLSEYNYSNFLSMTSGSYRLLDIIAMKSLREDLEQLTVLIFLKAEIKKCMLHTIAGIVIFKDLTVYHFVHLFPQSQSHY